MENVLGKFVEELAAADELFPVIGKAFAPIARKYNIAELRSSFFLAPSVRMQGEKDREDILYKSIVVANKSPAYSETFQLGEKGMVTFRIYRVEGSNDFTKEEQSEIKPIMDVLYMHFVRFRMINSMKRMHLTDLQTGLWNTGGFLAYADKLIYRGEISKYNGFYFNLVNFSLVNKRFGVKETDKILLRYIEILKEFLDEDECFGRLGGDNFVCLVKKERTKEFLNMLSGVTTFGAINDQEYKVVISAIAGICEIGSYIENSRMIMDDAGMALSIARYIEKKPYVYASGKIKEKVYDEKKYAMEFENAIRRGEFKAYYQPKVNIENFTVVGAEALVRWEREGKLISPGEFIPVFEKSGMICKLDYYMIEQVCADIRHWLKQGVEPVRVSLNLSRKHLSNPNLTEDIMKILKKYEMESKYIEIELTETVNEQEAEQLIAFMNEMKEHEVCMSIDDFGTGYSSLNLLRSFPVDVLKIDKSFIDTQEENDRIVLSNIIRMARELHMSVVAEGVETPQQMEYLRQMKCMVVQGYLFDKPMPVDIYEKRLSIGKYDMN